MKHLPRTQETVNRNLRDRVRNIERGTQFNPRPTVQEIAFYSQYGAVTVTALADTPEWDVTEGGQLVAVVVRLRTTGSTSTVVTIYLNGSSIGTVTVAASATRATAYLGDIRLKDADGLAAVVTTAGTGAAGLSVKARCKG